MLKLNLLFNKKPRFFFICSNIIAVITLFLYIFTTDNNTNGELIAISTYTPKIYKTEYTAFLQRLNIVDDIYTSFDIIDDYMTTNRYRAFESPNLMPKLKANYDRKTVVATKFGDQKYIRLLNKREEFSTDKPLYFLLKYYLWCLVNNINYPILPININEWQMKSSTKLNLFDLDNFTKCKCETDNINEIDYREQKESMYCKKKQSEMFLQQSDGFNPDLSMFLFKHDIDLDFLSVRIKIIDQPATKNLAIFLKEIDHFNHLDSKKTDNIYYPIEEIISEIMAFNSFNEPFPLLSEKNKIEESSYNLEEKDFTWDLDSKIDEYKTFPKQDLITDIDSIKQDRRHFIAQKYHNIKINLKNLRSKKYFYEVAIKSSIENVWRSGTHYDWRFFNGLKPLSERNEMLNDLFNAWSSFTKKDDIISWLSHGNLLSWAWTGGQFLWDKDLDIQLPILHFSFMAENYNNTLFMYMTYKNELKMYYLDINPNYVDIYHGKQCRNTIDGRFIDVQSGLYIDLTAIAYKQIELESFPNDQNLLNELHNLNWVENLDQRMMKGNDIADSKTVLLGDKNYHFYESLNSINPLRKVKYGHLESETYVPNKIITIINDEYQNGLIKTEYDDYNFDLDYHGWVKKCESKSEKTEHRNCEGLSDEQFDMTKKAWLNHYKRELQFCSHESVSATPYCQWFKTLHEEVEEQEEGTLRIFGSVHKYLSGKSESKLIEANLKVLNRPV